MMDLPTPPRWHYRAACLGSGPDLWFPGSGGDGLASIKAARTVCAECPVRGECLEWALSEGDVLVGIWAGTTQKERRELRRQRDKEDAA